MCQAYLSKHDVNIVIPRLCRVWANHAGFGFQGSGAVLKKAIDRENIILKSEDTTLFISLRRRCCYGYLKVASPWGER